MLITELSCDWPIVKDRDKELTRMDEEAQTEQIEEWLRMVDKPLTVKEGDNKDTEPREESDNC